MKKAIIKYNNGNGAVLCSTCSVIIRQGSEMTAEDKKAMKGELKLEAQYCDKHRTMKKKRIATCVVDGKVVPLCDHRDAEKVTLKGINYLICPNCDAKFIVD